MRSGRLEVNEYVLPPIYRTGVTAATGQTYSGAGISSFAATPTPVIIDLTTICGTGAKAEQPQGTDDYNPNPAGHYLMMQADGDNIYCSFGDSVAILGTLSPSVVTGVTGASFGAGALATFTGATGSTTTGFMLPKNTWPPARFKLPPGRPPPGTASDNADVGRYSPARYLQFASGTTGSSVYLRIWQASD